MKGLLMKKVILASLIAATAASSYAAETTTLKVQGKIITAACTPNLSNGGVVDFGAISLGELSATDVTQLGQKNITLSITCDSAAKVAWTTSDDRNDSLNNIEIVNADAIGGNTAEAAAQYGLGKTAEGVNIGAYAVTVNVPSVTADGAAKDAISTDDGTVWSKSATGSMLNGNGGFIRNMTVAESGSLAPVAFTQASFPLLVTAAVDNSTNLAITDETILDGQTTISLVYL
jgi:hypothetical protein